MAFITSLCIWCVLYLGCAGAANPKGKGGQRKWGLNQIWTHAHDVGHMPELSELVHKPGLDNTVAICATMKDENATDVREWLLYYRCFPFLGLLLLVCDCLPGVTRAALARCCFPTALLLPEALTPEHTLSAWKLISGRVATASV